MPKKRNFLGGMQNYDPANGQYEPNLTTASGEQATPENVPGGENKKGFNSFTKNDSFDEINKKRMGTTDREDDSHAKKQEENTFAKNDKEPELQESNSKQSALEKHLGKKVTQGYDENVFEVDGEEYFIGTEEEADERAKEEVRNIIDDMGLEAFSENFQEEIIGNYVDEDFFEDLKEEEAQYLEDEGELETAEYYRNMSANEYAEELRMNYGDKEFANLVKDHIDWDAVIEQAVSMDGAAHFIAHYDGESVDIGNGLYAYRMN